MHVRRLITIASALLLAASPALAASFGGYGLASVRIAVKDPARSVAFYKILGMKAGSNPHAGQQEMGWENDNQGAGLTLIELSKATEGLAPGTAWIRMYVPDMAQTLTALRAAGFAHMPDPALYRPKPGVPPRSDHTVAIIRDPDGNHVQLVAPTPK